MTAPVTIPRLAWPDFLAGFRWRQGEHVSIIGPTGCGKSTLTAAILPRREYAVVLGTKPKDRTLDALIHRDGFARIKTWEQPWYRRQPGAGPRDLHRVALWPTYRHKDDKAGMAGEFDAALSDIFAQGGWCVVVDEVYYVAHELGLHDWLVTLWTQGRSLGLSVVGGTQRPAYVPLYMYDQAVHLFFFADNDERNLRRVGGLGGLSANAVRATVAALPEHDVLYVNTRTRQLAVTRVR